MSTAQPWHGIVVAAPTLFHEDLSIDLDGFQHHMTYLAANGCAGVTPAGSLGEYQSLTEVERRDLVRCAVEAAPNGFSVVPGVSAYGADEAYRWSVAAADAGADAVLCQPPTTYRATTEEVIAHFRRVSEAGLPVVAYNNPVDNNVDLTPELLYDVVEAVPSVVALKDFSGEPPRAYRMAELTPHIDLVVGMDGVVVELIMAGAVGWIAGFPSSLPRLCAAIFENAIHGDVETALDLYRRAQPLLRWDADRHFIQAIKISMEAAGRYGGPVRLPRLPLDADVAKDIARTTSDLMPIEADVVIPSDLSVTARARG
jgi:4-hydroxy-tetrahydrodipicolinate synthase